MNELLEFLASIEIGNRRCGGRHRIHHLGTRAKIGEVVIDRQGLLVELPICRTRVEPLPVTLRESIRAGTRSNELDVFSIAAQSESQQLVAVFASVGGAGWRQWQIVVDGAAIYLFNIVGNDRAASIVLTDQSSAQLGIALQPSDRRSSGSRLSQLRRRSRAASPRPLLVATEIFRPANRAELAAIVGAVCMLRCVVALLLWERAPTARESQHLFGHDWHGVRTGLDGDPKANMLGELGGSDPCG